MSRLGAAQIKSSLAAVFVLLIITGCSKNIENPFPKEMRDVKLGFSKADVTDAIRYSGKRSESPVPKRRNRIRLIWITDFDPNLETICFDFTELDRLYAIRFLLKPGRGAQEKNVRDFLLQEYSIPTDFPGKMRMIDDDVLAYVGRDEVTTSLFEFTNMLSGRKTYEIFDRKISAVDFRKALPKEPKGQSAKKGAISAPTPAPEDQVGWGEPEKTQRGPTRETYPANEPPNAQPTPR